MNTANQLQGTKNRAVGETFEALIESACERYRLQGKADIQKTPEPFKVTRSLQHGMFAGHFAKQAQPDFKGVLKGGKMIAFDAKHTTTGKITLDALTAEQHKCLDSIDKLGGSAFVLCGWDFARYALIPYHVFVKAKELNRHKYWTATEAGKYGVSVKYGYLDFLAAARLHAYDTDWQISSDGYYPYCPECFNEPPSGELTNYCPHCGQDMRKEG